MKTSYPTTGTVNFGAFRVTFVASEEGNWVTLYDANIDDESTREYATMNEVLETVTLLVTSATAREEFFV